VGTSHRPQRVQPNFLTVQDYDPDAPEAARLQDATGLPTVATVRFGKRWLDRCEGDMKDLDEHAVAGLAAFLEERWTEDFATTLAEDQDATLGFALARALSCGWITPSEGMDRFIEAAQDFKEVVGDQ